jgi:hypothetical protein
VVTIELTEGHLILDVQGLDRLWSLRSTLRIPIEHVRGAQEAAGAGLGWFEALKLGGSSLPGVLTAGTFYQNGGLVFWDVHDGTTAIRIALHDETYRELVVEVEDPAETVARINAAVGRRS